jgi:hypothetical protein
MMLSEMEKKYPRIYHRHFRKVAAYPDGVITHDGDCGIYRIFNICTCGLHHALMVIPDDATKIYPKYWDEQEGLSKVDMLMNIDAHDGGLWVKCDECEGKGGIGEIICTICEGKGLIPFKMPDPISDEKAKEIFNNIFTKPGDKEIIDKMFDEDQDKKIPEN